MKFRQNVQEPALQKLPGYGPAQLGPFGEVVIRVGAGGGCQTHHGEVAGGPVDVQLAQQLLGQGHLVGGSVVGHVQPLHVLHQGLLVVLLSEQVIALGKQVLHQLEQKGLPGVERRGGSGGLLHPAPPLPLLDTQPCPSPSPSPAANTDLIFFLL